MFVKLVNWRNKSIRFGEKKTYNFLSYIGNLVFVDQDTSGSTNLDFKNLKMDINGLFIKGLDY